MVARFGVRGFASKETQSRLAPSKCTMKSYEVEAEPEVLDEIERNGVNVDRLASEAESYLADPDVDDTALARMFIEQGHSEALSYWLVRLANVRHAPR